MPTRYQNAVYRRECRQLPRSRVSSSLPDRDSSKAGDSSPAAAAARTRRLQHPTTSTRLSRHPIVTHTYPGTHTHTRQAFPMPLPTAISPKSKRRGREKVEGCDQPRHRAGCLSSSPPLPPSSQWETDQNASRWWCADDKRPVAQYPVSTSLKILLPTVQSQTDDVQLSHVHVDLALIQHTPRPPSSKTGRREMSSRSPEHDAAAQKEK